MSLIRDLAGTPFVVAFIPCLEEAVDVRLRRGWRLRLPNALSPRDLVSRPDNMDETVLHTYMRKQRHQADERRCFRSIDSTIPLLPKSEISSL